MHGYAGLIAALLVISAGSAEADVYAYKDEAGVEHYTNEPNLDGYQLLVAVLREEGKDNRAQVEPASGGVSRFAPQVTAAAEKYNVDQALVHAVIVAESGYNAKAVSRVGAQGLMQLMPGTAKRYDVANAFDPAQNIEGGTRYLRDLLDLFGNDLELAVAAYNAGENAVIRHGRKVPPYRETMAYVPKVIGLYQKFKSRL